MKKVSSESMCLSISCRVPNLNQECRSFSGKGAAEGTLCSPGKTCQKGVCQPSETASDYSCPFGDDLIRIEELPEYLKSKISLPNNSISCNSAFNLWSDLKAASFCSESHFRNICCSTCKSNYE